MKIIPPPIEPNQKDLFLKNWLKNSKDKLQQPVMIREIGYFILMGFIFMLGCIGFWFLFFEVMIFTAKLFV